LDELENPILQLPLSPKRRNLTWDNVRQKKISIFFECTDRLRRSLVQRRINATVALRTVPRDIGGKG
jgi:hypothetical protein